MYRKVEVEAAVTIRFDVSISKRHIDIFDIYRRITSGNPAEIQNGRVNSARLRLHSVVDDDDEDTRQL